MNQRNWPFGTPPGTGQGNGPVVPLAYQGQRPAQTMAGRPPSPVNMGNSQVLQRPLSASQINFQTVLENRADNADSRNLTITTLVNQIQLPDIVNTLRFTSIIGKITWGVGGTQTFAEFDWHNGNQFSINSTFFTLEAAINTADNNTPAEINVGAFYTMGARPARAQLTRTFPQLSLSAAGVSQASIPVPPFAHAVYIFDSNRNFYSPGNATIRYAGGPTIGATYLTGDVVQFEADGSDFLEPIFNEDGARFPEQTRFIQIINNSMVEAIQPTVMFTLNL